MGAEGVGEMLVQLYSGRLVGVVAAAEVDGLVAEAADLEDSAAEAVEEVERVEAGKQEARGKRQSMINNQAIKMADRN